MFFVPDFITPAKPTPAPQRRLTAAQTITVALTGNPNSGKTTIFNNLTGARQRVGNYGGVTVETKQGRLTYGSYRINVVDLPGTYSLSAYSPDEMVARDYLIEQKPDVIVDIVDGSNLERNLYLAVQLKEMKLPLVVALNMADELKNQHLHVDLEKLSRDLGAPVIPTIGTQKIGMKHLLEKIIEVAQGAWTAPVTPRLLRAGNRKRAGKNRTAPQPKHPYSRRITPRCSTAPASRQPHPLDSPEITGKRQRPFKKSKKFPCL